MPAYLAYVNLLRASVLLFGKSIYVGFEGAARWYLSAQAPILDWGVNSTRVSRQMLPKMDFSRLVMMFLEDHTETMLHSSEASAKLRANAHIKGYVEWSMR